MRPAARLTKVKARGHTARIGAGYHAAVTHAADAGSSAEAPDLARTLRLPDGSALAYRIARAAAPAPAGTLVLLHGLASNLTRWTEFVERTTLRQTWNLVRVDLRGHGGSFTRGPVGLELWCGDLLALLDREHCARALLAGHSLGANLALHFAARHPARVRGLALIDPVWPEPRGVAMRSLRCVLPLVRALIGAIRLLNRLGLHRGEIAHRDLRRLDEAMRRDLLAAGEHRRFVRAYSSPLADLEHFPTANYLQELVELLRPLPPLDRLRTPVLVLVSQRSAPAAIAAARRAVARAPHAELLLLDACHWPLTERPQAVREALERWCTRVAAGPPHASAAPPAGC